MDQSSGTLSEVGSPVSAADVSWAQNRLATHRHRVEALRKTIGALDTHMDDEAAWLGITDHKGALRQSQPAGQGIRGAESRETLSDSVSLDRDTETNHRQKGMSIKNEIKDEKDELGMCLSLLLSKNIDSWPSLKHLKSLEEIQHFLLF